MKPAGHSWDLAPRAGRVDDENDGPGSTDRHRHGGPTPYWALLERQLLDAQAQACAEFFERYFDDRGYLQCVPRWSGDDGPDDALENLLNWTMLHALGADDRILQLFRRGMEGHLRQYTEARTTDVPLGRDGMYYQEFHACFDWMHHGEAWSPIVLHGLSEPDDRALLRRMRRWAGMYMAEDPHTPNYDPQHRVIRSFFNGSRGPLLRQATALDWAGDPIDVAGRFRTLHGETSYQEMLDHFRDYTDVVGDNPMNLGATTLAFTAYALTGEMKYRDWVLEYVDAWVERTEANDGLLPTSVGLDGKIDSGYGWYGGVYGWGFSVLQIPFRGAGGPPAHDVRAGRVRVRQRAPAHRRAALRRPLAPDARPRERQQQTGGWRRSCTRTCMGGSTGWIDCSRAARSTTCHAKAPRAGTSSGPTSSRQGRAELYYWTFDRTALDLLPETPPWVRYLDGEDESYPEEALQADLEDLRSKVERMRADVRTPDTTLSDDPNPMNPATTDALVRLMLGGLPVGRTGYPLHCRAALLRPEAAPGRAPGTGGSAGGADHRGRT